MEKSTVDLTGLTRAQLDDWHENAAGYRLGPDLTDSELLGFCIDVKTELEENVSIRCVNAIGRAEIHEFLLATHKKGAWATQELDAWVADANFSLAEGNPAIVEIPERDSITHRTETFDVSPEGVSSYPILR